MKTLTHIALRCLLMSFFIGWLPIFNLKSQCLFPCTDTHYGSSEDYNFFRSRFHLIQAFGDVSLKRTNFYTEGYNGFGGWMESRIFFPRFSSFLNKPSNLFPLPDPYITGIIKEQKGLDWEDRIDYGLGLEWRPFKNFKFPENSVLNYLFHLRFYSVYLKTEFLKNGKQYGWFPKNDLRFGSELYRECNLYQSKRTPFWSELWADFSWRRSNFVNDEFETWSFSVVPKIGMKLFSEQSVFMPYITGELSATGEKEAWQNRVLVGAGIRSMPFGKTEKLAGTLLQGMRIYIEGNYALVYLKNEAVVGTPDHDIRIGITYVINRWQYN